MSQFKIRKPHKITSKKSTHKKRTSFTAFKEDKKDRFGRYLFGEKYRAGDRRR